MKLLLLNIYRITFHILNSQIMAIYSLKLSTNKLNYN